jgi:hypothetical protein
MASSNVLLVIAIKLTDKYKFNADYLLLLNFLFIPILSGASLASLCIRHVVANDCKTLPGAKLECPLLALYKYKIS